MFRICCTDGHAKHAYNAATQSGMFVEVGGKRGCALLDEGGGDVLGQFGEDGLHARLVAGLGARYGRDGRHELLRHLGQPHLPARHTCGEIPTVCLVCAGCHSKLRNDAQLMGEFLRLAHAST